MYTRNQKPHWFSQFDRTETLIDLGMITVAEMAKELGVPHQTVYLYVTTRKKEPRADVAFKIQELTNKLIYLHVQGTGPVAKYKRALKKIQKKHQ